MFLVHWSNRSRYGNARRQVLYSISRRVLRSKIYRDIPGAASAMLASCRGWCRRRNAAALQQFRSGPGTFRFAVIWLQGVRERWEKRKRDVAGRLFMTKEPIGVRRHRAILAGSLAVGIFAFATTVWLTGSGVSTWRDLYVWYNPAFFFQSAAPPVSFNVLLHHALPIPRS